MTEIRAWSTPGTDVAAQPYSLPTACFFSPTYGAASMMITDEATFTQMFHCQAGATSGVDFSTHRLQVAVYTGVGSTPTTWVVEGADAIHIGLSPAPWCGGTAPPSQFTLILLRAGPHPVVQDLCTTGCDFGSGGYPA